MKLLRPTLLAPILAIAGVVAACAQTSIPVGDPGVAGYGWPIPFGLEQYTTFQQLYDHTLFSNSINIGGLTFFALNDLNNSPTHNPPDDGPLVGAIAPSTYSIQLGTVPWGILLGPDLNANLAWSSDLTNFFSGPLGGNVDGQFTIVGNQNNFSYDPNNGDLILYIFKPPETPAFTIGLDYTENPLVSIAYANQENPPGGLFDCSAPGCTDALGLITQFEAAGQSQSVPVLPEVLNTGSFQFTDQPSGSWFDPPTAYGFHYIGTFGTQFASMTFPTGFTGSLLDSTNTLLDTFSGGGTYIFTAPASDFSITGLSPLVDPSSPTAFPLYLEFADQTGSFTMDPLYPPSEVTGSIPEPGSIALLAAGVLMLSILRRIRPCA
jgi:hypothetical protein